MNFIFRGLIENWNNPLHLAIISAGYCISLYWVYTFLLGKIDYKRELKHLFRKLYKYLSEII